MSRGRQSLTAIAVAILAAGLGWYLLSRRSVRSNPAVAAYIDTQQCRACHAEIYRDYQAVGMAQSFRAGSDALAPASFFHSASGRHYEIIQRGGKTFQRRYERGREAQAFELEVTHTIGSGNHARTYLHRTATGELIQLPLTWYTQEQSWGMSPGYDHATPPDFTRLIDDSCLFCHNSYPSSSGDLAQGIDCQRCHGPGSLHVQIASSGGRDSSSIRAAVVNPKRLTPELQMDICMQCHLETTSAELPQMVRRFDRAPFSFRPGEPLGAYMVHFDHPAGSHEDKFEIVNQAYRLRQSACFRESGGQMTCSSCHNPHHVPRGVDAVSHYRNKCVDCHKTVALNDHPDLRTADCTPCHMPSRRAEDAVHVVMTDHLIQRNRPAADLTRPLKEHASAYRGDLAIYHPRDLSPADRDQYLGVALVSGGADRQRGIGLLERTGAHPKALAVLAEGYLAEGNTDQAIATFKRAIEAQPGLAKAHHNLGQALAMANRNEEARHAFEMALKVQPTFPEAVYALANLLLQLGDATGAEHQYREAIRQRPVYAEAYNNLARVLASQNRLKEALDHAGRAVRLKPEASEARYNFARLLQETGATEAAFAEYRALLDSNPAMIEAHLALGQALGDAGRLDAAVAEFREVLRLRPHHAEAQRNLEMALSLKRMGGR